MTPWLVIPCPGSRAEELARCLDSLDADPNRTVITTALHHDYLQPDEALAKQWTVDGSKRFSIARLWNRGLRMVYEADATSVAVFASDTTGRPDSITLLADLMATTGCVMAAPAFDGETRILDGPRTAHDRIPGGCWMIDARHRLLCDEHYRWWYADDDLEMRARKVGPVGLFAGVGLTLGPDAGLDTAEKKRWAAEDRARFVAEHGCEPW